MRIYKQILAITLAIFIILTTVGNSSALAADTANGAKIFTVNCAACHPNGGNIIRWGKGLKKWALRWNKMDSIEAISSLVAKGKNNMSAFQDRLTQEEINDVAVYVLQQADQGWR